MKSAPGTRGENHWRELTTRPPIPSTTGAPPSGLPRWDRYFEATALLERREDRRLEGDRPHDQVALKLCFDSKLGPATVVVEVSVDERNTSARWDPPVVTSVGPAEAIARTN
jgi:hypothetical protein